MKKKIQLIGFAIAAVSSLCATLPAMADLPSGYRQLDYVDTDGNQWVNTLFRPTCTNAVEIKAAIKDMSVWHCLYCSRRASGNRMYTLFVNPSTKKPRFDYDKQIAAGGAELIEGVPYVFAASPSENEGQEGVDEKSKKWTLTCTIDGADPVELNGEYFTPDSKAYFCLFGSYTKSEGAEASVLNDSTDVDNRAKCRFYHFKVWDTKERGNLLCHIVPVYDEVERAIGLYDLVAGRFLPVHGNPFTGAYALAADEDWTDNESAFGDGITVDLNGNDLTVGTVATNTTSAFAGSDYQDLAYVLANGKQAVQITDFKLPGTAKVEMKLRPNANVAGTTEFLFCSRTAGKQDTYSCCMMDSGYLRFDFNNKQTTGDTVAPSIGEDYTLVFDGTTAKPTWSVNGTTEKVHDATSNDFTGGSDLILFGNSLAGTISCRLYYFTVTTNGVTALNLRPARRLSDGVVGLYDAVGGAFYTSGTSAAFPGLATPKFSNTSATDSELRVGQKIIPGYTAVECITASDSFIKTGFIPAATDRLEMKASLSAVSTTYGLFCSRKVQTEEMFAALFTTDGIRFDFNKGKGGQKNSKFIPKENEVFTVALDGNEKACYTNGALAATFTSNDFTPTATVYLFALHENNGKSSSRAPGSIYCFKVRGADGTLKRHMVPVVRNSDSVAGLYDLVERAFYPSANQYAFTAGAIVGDGTLCADVDSAFDATEIGANITLVKNGESAFDGGGTTLAGALKVNAGTVGGVTLLDGAKLDISDASAPFSLDDNAISFANGAKIYVYIGSRTIAKNTPVVSWTSAPSNIGGLKFCLVADGEEQAMLVKTDGLYPAPKGLIISFR